MELDRSDAVAAAVGWAFGAVGVGLWFVDATAAGWGVIVLGGFVCGVLAGESANEAAEPAFKLVMLPALAVAIVGAVGFALVETGFELTAGLAVAVGFVVWVVVGLLPVMLLPFVLASLLGGGVRGKLSG